jgi:hypothetical protein
VVTLGPTFAYILVPWLGSGLPSNRGGTPIPTHPTTTLRTWLARTHPPDRPHLHPTPDILWWVHIPFLGSLCGLSLRCLWGFQTLPVWLFLDGSGGGGIPFLVGVGSILLWVSETHRQKAWAQVTHSPRPFSLACH